MSIYKSYFDKSDTLIYNSYTNTGRNPIVELFYGRANNTNAPIGFSRYIFNVDLTKLTDYISEGIVSTGCTGFSGITHTLRMTNTSFFDNELLNDTTSQGRRRATSFDLVLLRIPKYSGSTGSPQSWDSGVGYDYYDFGVTNLNDRSFSTRPTNWFERTTINDWSTPGIYDNTNSITGLTGLRYSALTVVDTQHFEFGNEDIEFNMTNEINSILSGSLTGVTGWMIVYYPQVENLSGMSENYSVGFFSPHTQTFYEPFLETSYNDLINDNRNDFHCGLNNELYLYIYDNGTPTNLDVLPTVDILDANGDAVPGFTGLTTCLVTTGVYKVSVNNMSCTDAPCIYYDVWKGIIIDGQTFGDQENEFALLEKSGRYQIGTTTDKPKIYGFNFDGIKQNEKVLNTDVRKVNVSLKQAYSTNTVLNSVNAYYRIYVREGANTEVQVQDWTRINKTTDGYYFVFDTTDKIPNEYFVDIKVVSDKNTDTYKRELQFQIVNKK
jgi:hypothetical protein